MTRLCHVITINDIHVLLINNLERITMKKLSLFLMLFSPLFLIGCDEAEPLTDELDTNNVTPINVVRVVPFTFNRVITIPGSIVAKDNVFIKTSLTDEEILTTLVDVGDVVKKGQILAILEHTNVQSQLQQSKEALSIAKANLQAQKANLAESQKTLDRYSFLIKTKAINQQDFDKQDALVATYIANVASAKAEIKKVEAEITNSERERAKAEIKAPSDGLITERFALSGNLTNAEALFTLAKNSVAEIEAEPNAEELASLKIGMKAEVIIDKNTVIPGVIRLITPQLNNSTRTGKVRVAFNDERFVATIGAFADTNIHLDVENVKTAIPFSSVLFKTNGKSYAMTVDDKGLVNQVEIVVGTIDNHMVEVRSGLKPTDTVIYQANAFINSGDKIKPVLVNNIDMGK